MSALPRWRLWLLFLLLSLATRGPFLGIGFLNVDEAAHLVGSWELLRGGRLYADFADHKPPLIYVYYAVAQLLLGHGLFAVRLFTAVVALPATALGLAAVYGHDRRGAWAGAIFLVAGAAFLASDMQAVNGEVVMLWPAAWAMACVADAGSAGRAPRCFLAGLLLGLAVLVKPQAAFFLPAVAWAAGAPPGRRAARLAALAAGLAAPVALALAVCTAQGTLRDFVYWNLTHNAAYTANPFDAEEAARRLGQSLLPFLAATAPLWWAAARGQRLLDPHRRGLLLGALAWSVPAVLLGLRLFPHYFIQLYLPLALLAAPVAAAWTRPWPWSARAAVSWTALLLAGFTAANLWLAPRYEENRPVFAAVAAHLRADACQADARLFVWGFAPGFYVASEMRPASRFVVPTTTLSGYLPGNRSLDAVEARRLIRDDHWRLLLDDLERSRATYVLDTAASGLHHWRGYPAFRFPPLWDLLRREFEPVADVEGVQIYRRRGCDSQGR